jgi:hypothetical protein
LKGSRGEGSRGEGADDFFLKLKIYSLNPQQLISNITASIMTFLILAVVVILINRKIPDSLEKSGI